MICLACGNETEYGKPRCLSCNLALPAFPPYVASNHVCQLQLSLAAYEQGRLSREELLARYNTFAEVVMSVDSKWSLAQGSALLERLAEPLRARYAGGVAELDRGCEALMSAIGLFDRWAEQAEDGLLEQADELLTDFFRHTCGGCAWLIHELELEALSSVKLGTLHDYMVE